MSQKAILLVEDSPDDEELAMLAFEECRIANEIVVVRDGQEALDYFFGHRGPWPARMLRSCRNWCYWTSNCRRWTGLEVLKPVAEPIRGRSRLPIVILTSSIEEEDLITGYDLGSQQLRPQASGIHPLRRGLPPTSDVLARPERSPNELRGDRLHVHSACDVLHRRRHPRMRPSWCCWSCRAAASSRFGSESTSDAGNAGSAHGGAVGHRSLRLIPCRASEPMDGSRHLPGSSIRTCPVRRRFRHHRREAGCRDHAGWGQRLPPQGGSDPAGARRRAGTPALTANRRAKRAV